MMIRTLENVYSNKEDNELGKVIRKYSIARRLLEVGGDKVRIIDLKPDRTDPDRKRTVFVFRNDDAFQEVLTKVLDEKAQSKNEHELQSEIDILKKKVEELSNIAVLNGQSVEE